MSANPDELSPAIRTISAERPSISARARAFYELGKPNLSALVVVTAALGFHLASSPASATDWLLLVHLIAGTALTAAGACAMNMVLERGFDASMRRTRDRPIPSGRVEPTEAAAFAIALFLVGLADLALFCGWLPALLSLASALIYVALYTPLKRRGPVAIWVGAVVGALPPVMGWAAVSGEIGLGGLVLFSILFAWQFPHFLALGFMYREDYRRAGFRFVSEDSAQVGRQVAAGCALLIGTTLLPIPLGLLGWPIYGTGALIAGGLFLVAGIRFARNASPGRARAAFFASITYLPLLLALMIVDRLLG